MKVYVGMGVNAKKKNESASKLKDELERVKKEFETLKAENKTLIEKLEMLKVESK